MWREEGYEPYSDEQDSDVTVNGMPEPFGEDSAMTNRYENWKRNYKRVPNEKFQPWAYTGEETGPDMWSSLSKKFQMCDPDLTGPNSSPIDISTLSTESECYGPSFRVQSTADWEGAETAHLYEKMDRSVTVEVMHCKQECAICKAECTKGPTMAKTAEHPELKLDRFIVHTPSEHKINGEAIDMEIQFYMCDASVDQHVIPCIPKMAMSVLFQDGGDSVQDLPFLFKLMATVPKLQPQLAEIDKTFNFGDVKEDLAPLLKEYYNYWGSQTYPPCYQGVEWMVSKTVVPVSSGLLKSLRNVQGENVRPSMPIGTRKVSLMSPEAHDHWTYEGPRGQAKWGTLDLAYSGCGKQSDCEQLPNQAQRDVCLAAQAKQSPISIVTAECMPNVDQSSCATQLGSKTVKYNAGGSGDTPIKVYVRDCECQPCDNPFNGYAVTVVIPGSPYITYADMMCGINPCRFYFKEMTFHTPAEHALDGRRPAMEAQFLLTKQGEGTPSLGIAVHFEQGATSPQWLADLAMIADDATGTPKEIDPALNFAAIAKHLAPSLNVHYTYEGSMTAPPCSTGIKWLVLKKRPTATLDDLSVFKARHVGGNARDLQGINGRDVGIVGTVA